MRKILSALVAAVMILSAVPIFAEDILEGSGTVESPYLISTEAELILFRDKVNSGETTACAKLTADIELMSKWETPIGTDANKYSGIFDGNDCTISGIYGSGGQWGFFKYTNGGEIKNLTLKAGNEGTINVYHQSALFVAIAENNTKITKCAGYGNITTSDGYIGGITCQGACIVENCYFIGDIAGANWVTGMGMGAVATNCFVYGTIKATATAFKVANGSDTDDTKNFYLSIESPGVYGYGTQKTEAEFKSGEIAYILNSGNMTDVFGQNLSENGDLHPAFLKSGNRVTKIKDEYVNVADDWAPPELIGGGTETDPYLINNKEVLELFRDRVNKGDTAICARLTTDIDMGNEKWIPIGNATTKFSGVFDGDGYEIKNIVNNGNKWGFFGETDGGTIKNLTIRAGSDCEVENTISAFGHECGLFIGIASNDTVLDHCAGYGNLTGYGQIGGITSKGACIITNSYFVGDVSGSGDISGLGFNAKATDCFVMGNVVAKGNSFKVCNGSAINCYYISSTGAGVGGYGTQKDENAFLSGEVAYLLGENFGQLLGKDEHPVWRNSYNAVEKVLNGYNNTYAIPAVGDVEFIRADGASMEADAVSSYTDEIIIRFTGEMDEASMKGAIELDGVDFTGNLSDNKADYIITITDGKIPLGKYNLKIKKSVINSLGNSLKEDYSIEFTVADSDGLIITSAVTAEGTSLATIKNGEAVSFTINGYNPLKTKQKMTVILMGYKTSGGVKEMTASVVKPIEISGNTIEINENVMLSPKGFDDAEEVKLFVWGYPLQTRLTPAKIFKQ